MTTRKLERPEWRSFLGGDEADVTVVPDERLRWIERLPLMHVDNHRIFVHAGLDPNCSLEEQDPREVIWKIYNDHDDGAASGTAAGSNPQCKF